MDSTKFRILYDFLKILEKLELADIDIRKEFHQFYLRNIHR